MLLLLGRSLLLLLLERALLLMEHSQLLLLELQRPLLLLKGSLLLLIELPIVKRQRLKRFLEIWLLLWEIVSFDFPRSCTELVIDGGQESAGDVLLLRCHATRGPTPDKIGRILKTRDVEVPDTHKEFPGSINALSGRFFGDFLLDITIFCWGELVPLHVTGALACWAGLICSHHVL